MQRTSPRKMRGLKITEFFYKQIDPRLQTPAKSYPNLCLKHEETSRNELC